MNKVLEFYSLYETNRMKVSDIFQHIPTLRDFSFRSSGNVIEFGTRHGVSTVALLAGILDRSPSKRGKLITCDIDKKEKEVQFLSEVSQHLDTEFEYFDFNTFTESKDKLPNCGLLFIDTLHVEEQIYRELSEFSSLVEDNGYILMHDTVTFWSSPELPTYTSGLGPGITRFMEENKEWEILEHFTYNNGLMVLGRV